MTTSAPTGEQYHLTLETGDGPTVTAIVTEVAAGLRGLQVGGVEIAETFDEHETPPSACGITLVPWPNRVDGGSWSLDGTTQQLDITEVAKGNASHGLLRYSPYRAIEVEPDAITQAASVFPSTATPFVSTRRCATSWSPMGSSSRTPSPIAAPGVRPSRSARTRSSVSATTTRPPSQ